ncbi:hypothetical protein [uncultured Algibacter sp.]|uniref:hypothetical protein n=1 Tax=uncultured Algibacter sp. TaxID=298659 RepID=UPI0026228288|nr:hypothetical protein [uncultured Algibacter sp.]
MKLKLTLIVALTITAITTISWESYWRSQGYEPNLNDNKEIWATQRARVDKATTDDILTIGSSRIYFDIQLDEWQRTTGVKPIQLASQGTTPLPIFRDIVENTNFSGTIIVGVTPGLFFSTTYPEAFIWKRGIVKNNYFHKRTYAQKLNFYLGLPLEENLVFMSGDEEKLEDDVDLKSILRRCRFGNRTGKKDFLYYNFGDLSRDRNMKMTKRTTSDTSFANKIKANWKAILTSGDIPPPDKKSTMEYFLKDAKVFTERGGNLILLRCPSSGFMRGGEAKFLPRQDFWEDLVQQSNLPAYHFEDYEQFKNLNCPEWSHLSAEDATFFTAELAKIMLKDGVITNHKTN